MIDTLSRTKLCPKCKIVKSFDDFYKSSRRPHFVQSHCKTCQNSKKIVRSPGFYRAYDLKRNYGITIEEYKDMYIKQNGLCAICEEPEQTISLSVDHDHITGKIRGLLCTNCNNGLGRFKDDSARLRSALSYLGV